MPASKNRERKAIAAVACPDCGAPQGAPCRSGKFSPGLRHEVQRGRLVICRGRKLAWQMIRDKEIT